MAEGACKWPHAAKSTSTSIANKYAVDTSKIKGESEDDRNATAGATAGVTG
jgi:hypothetical protein